MAGFPTSGVGTHFGDTSIAEDVSDIIYQITPEDTPFFNMTGDTSSTGVVHEWQKRSLTTRQDNAQPEGFTYTFPTQSTLPTRVVNLNQVFNKEIRISNTEQAVTHHAISDLFADQMAVRMAEYKTDIEHTLIQGTIASGSATDTARRLEGMIQYIISGVTTYTDIAFLTTLSEVAFNDLIQVGWDEGGEPRDVLVHGANKRTISSFSASSTKFIAAEEQRLVNTISMYDSDFFPVQVQLSRDIPILTSAGHSGHSILFIDRTMVQKAWLRRSTAKRVPETADSADGIIVGECTLEVGNEVAHVYADDFLP